VVCLALGAGLGLSPAAAQDYGAPAPSGPDPSTLVFLERCLPPPEVGGRADAAATRWYGLDELVTRSAALGGSFRSLRGALGISQTGETDLGWSAAGLALGAARPAGGAALRVVARWDRASGAREAGGEAGGGAWVQAGSGVRLWASAPQLGTWGIAPPLRRSLELGGVIEAAGVCAWLSRAAPVPPAADASHAAGLGLRAGPWSLWVEARDRPLRGLLGVGARAGPFSLGSAVESHPVLGETLRLSFGLGSER
jgi:hypothetical protein